MFDCRCILGKVYILFLIALFVTVISFIAVACDGDDDDGSNDITEEIDPNLDSDGDSINDLTEVSELGQSLGLNRYGKDIIVEVDYFTRTTADAYGRKSYILVDEARIIVEQMFANAPVANADGSDGIAIHILVDDAIPDNKNYIGSYNNNTGYNWNDFQSYKDTYFTPEYANIAHYCLMVKDIGILSNGKPRGVSGMSRNANGTAFFKGAQDFIVALGQAPNYEDGKYVWDKFQAGTFAHELGHNLGLAHGGQDHINYKPNYLSIMNYSFQFNGLKKTGVALYKSFDYSRMKLPKLEESTPDLTCQNTSNWSNGLREKAGLGDGAEGFGTIYYCYNGNYQFTLKIVSDATKDIDWDCDNTVENGKVWANINQDFIECDSIVYHDLRKLESFSDWDKISYTGGGFITFNSSQRALIPLKTTLMPEPELSWKEVMLHLEDVKQAEVRGE